MDPYQVLEKSFGEWTSCPNMVACSSGTAALHLALESLQLPLGGEVLVPDFTMIACARAVTMTGLVPKFVDCDSELLMDWTSASAKLTRKTVAVMPVHVYGRKCDMENLTRFAKRHGLKIIEDLAEGHGIPPSKDSDAWCWSFYQNKIVCGAEGGAVAFKDQFHADRAKQLRCLGFTEDHDFKHIPRGMNYRLSNCHAELILDSLAEVDINIAKRDKIETWYDAIIPSNYRQPIRDVLWVYDVRVPMELQTIPIKSLVTQLNRNGVAARMGFYPMSGQPEYGVGDHHKTAEAFAASQEVFYLPVHPSMLEADVAAIVTQLKQAILT